MSFLQDKVLTLKQVLTEHFRGRHKPKWLNVVGEACWPSER